MLRTTRLALALLAGGMSFAVAQPATANNAAYISCACDDSDVPTLLSNRRPRLLPIECSRRSTAKTGTTCRICWPSARTARCTKSRLAEYYLAAHSPRVELPQIEEWLRTGYNLPQAEQMARLGLKRGLGAMPELPAENRLLPPGSTPKRARPADCQ